MMEEGCEASLAYVMNVCSKELRVQNVHTDKRIFKRVTWFASEL